jgi:elongation factor Ts
MSAQTKSNRNIQMSPKNNTKVVIITIEQIKELRDQTSISIMQCKKALEGASGDMDKALVILRKKSGEISAKKGDRTFKAGTIQSYIHANGNIGAMVELNCESDFVSGNEEFIALARNIAMHITATNPKFLRKEDISETDKSTAREVFEAEVKGKPEAVRKTILDGKLNAYFGEMVLMDQPYIKNGEVTIQQLIEQAVQKFGEKMAVRRYAVMYTLIIIFYIALIGIIVMLFLKRHEIKYGTQSIVSRVGRGSDHFFQTIFTAVKHFVSYLNRHTFIAIAHWIAFHILKRIRNIYVEVKHRFISTPNGKKLIDAVRGRGEISDHGASLYLRRISDR